MRMTGGFNYKAPINLATYFFATYPDVQRLSQHLGLSLDDTNALLQRLFQLHRLSLDEINASLQRLATHQELPQEKINASSRLLMRNLPLERLIEHIVNHHLDELHTPLQRAKMLFDYAWLCEDSSELKMATTYFAFCLDHLPQTDAFSRLVVQTRYVKILSDLQLYNSAKSWFQEIAESIRHLLFQDPVQFTGIFLTGSPQELLINTLVQISSCDMNDIQFDLARVTLNESRVLLKDLIISLDPDYFTGYLETVANPEIAPFPVERGKILHDNPNEPLLDRVIDAVNWQSLNLATWEHLLAGKSNEVEVLNYALTIIEDMDRFASDVPTHAAYLREDHFEKARIQSIRNRSFACADAFLAVFRRHATDPDAVVWLQNADRAVHLGRQLLLIIDPGAPLDSFEYSWRLYRSMIVMYRSDHGALLPRQQIILPDLFTLERQVSLDIESLRANEDKEYWHLYKRFCMLYVQILKRLYQKPLDEQAQRIMDAALKEARRKIDGYEEASSKLRMRELTCIERNEIL